MDDIEEILKDKNDIGVIIDAVCLINNLSKNDFYKKSRERYIIDVRRMAYSVCKDLLGFGWSRIGKEFKLNHASIIHHYKQHKSLLEIDRFYREKYEAILEVVKFEIGFIDAEDIINEIRLRREQRTLKTLEIKNQINNL
jgi:chromosomal replication initiation ATPase DnaA